MVEVLGFRVYRVYGFGLLGFRVEGLKESLKGCFMRSCWREGLIHRV